MSTLIAPADEAGIIDAVQAARAAREPLAIEGQGSKRGLLRPVQAARSVSTRALTGVTLYRPAELIISARAGTPLAEIEATVAEKGQQLIAEAPYLNGVFGTSAPPSIGGVVAANLSGPRRITWGATRDHVMGLRFINGAGEAIRSGGRVLKNVTGLDLCKLLSGSYGTLGVITEVTLKVLP
ncbi:MAG: FAD-binding protein, partial [Alphaproteobacteria bacterium]